MDAIGQSNFLQALGWAVLNSLWQLALLWVIYQLITSAFKSASPAHKSTLASLLLLSGFAWFLFTFISIIVSGSSSDAIISSAYLNFDNNQQLNAWLYKTLPVASVFYLILLILPLVQFARNYRFVQKIREQGLSKIPVEWRMFVRRVAEQMGIKKTVHIWLSELVSSPVTIGFIKPVILVPIAAMNHLTTRQLEAVLLHELAHIRRFDYFINLVLKFIETILYFNPFVKAFVRIVEREREKSCDEMVMQFQYDAHGYASALLVLEKANHLPKPFTLAAQGKKPDLLHRIEWILGVRRKQPVSFNKLAGLMAGLLCIIGLNALVILSQPANNRVNSSLASTSFSSMDSPFYFFADGYVPASNLQATQKENNYIAESPSNHTIQNNLPLESFFPIEMAEQPEVDEAAIHAIINPFAIAVANIEMPPVPQLNKFQEQQVEEALKASKKVLQEGIWKELDKTIAEALTQEQKEEVKSEYLREMSKINMEKYESELTKAYDLVDWDKVNAQLETAISNIRVDSLKNVYYKALTNLDKVSTELKLNNLTGIPDTDVTLVTLDKKKNELNNAINKLKGVRAKKIVRL